MGHRFPKECPFMPIYEYYCPDNNKLYSFFARSLAMRDRVPRCPDDATLRMEKRVSRFAVTKSSGDAESGPEDDLLAGLDESKMESMMMEMEKEMSGMDQDNPDPRQLAGFMKKMAGAMGGKVPDAMQEMISRLEKGEDPDALEAEFSDAFDDDEMLAAFTAAKGSRTRTPDRDPKLYEMSDYVEM
ncbi:MAG: hypothetical protein ACI9R3_003467 [Verrucomicrobiales bacterium]|jgi:hypothetical protein